MDPLFFRLTGIKCDSNLILKMNNNKLSVNGDAYFFTSLKFWKTILGDKLECHENCTDIIQHYAHTQNVNPEQVKTTETSEKIFQSLLSSLNAWGSERFKFKLTKDRVCLFWNRPIVIKNTISEVLEERRFYGESEELKDESVDVMSQFDESSEMTNARLRVLELVCKRILELQGCCVNSEVNSTILLTSRSLEKKIEDCDICVCGVVKNSQTNRKEKRLTYEEYIDAKVKILTEMAEQRNVHVDKSVRINKFSMRNHAVLATYFELLSVNPSHPVFMNLRTDVDKSCTNTKGWTFIEYNDVRIEAIMKKLHEGIQSKEYGLLKGYLETDFSVLNDEDEWELVYNFLFKYPLVIKDSISLKPTFKFRPHIICMFLSQLVQKFSAYYSKIKILTKGAEHLQMQLSARIHLLRAIQIVLKNGIEIFDVERRVNDYEQIYDRLPKQ